MVTFGAVALGVYLAVAAATLALSGRRLLPLFEGVGPPPPYQWVNPPPAFKSGNTKPGPATVDIAFRAGKSQAASAFTADSQLVINITAGAFDPHDSDTAVRAVLTPLDPATLGPVPAGLFADGNAYRIALSYQPSNTAVDAVAGQGSISLTAPNPGLVLLYSSDGRTWTKLASQSVAATSTVFSTFTSAGWYLVGAGPTAVPPGGNGNRLGTAAIAALVAALAILFVAAPVAVRAVRRRRPAGREGPDPGPGPPPGRSPVRGRRR
jgi:hypothetical protein